MQFINHWATIQEYNENIHDPIYPIPYQETAVTPLEIPAGIP